MKAIVVYFSRSGVTRAAAEYIAGRLGADIFEIEAAEPYPAEFRPTVQRALREIQDGLRVELAAMPDVSGCELVIIGSPTWCGTFAPPAASFIAAAPLEGKRVGIFCTSGGSGLSGTVNEVKSLEPNATVTQGLHIGSGSSSNPDNAVSEWLNALGLAK